VELRKSGMERSDPGKNPVTSRKSIRGSEERGYG
jgi:hypothetical protein